MGWEWERKGVGEKGSGRGRDGVQGVGEEGRVGRECYRK